jgi:hypothetical protein
MKQRLIHGKTAEVQRCYGRPQYARTIISELTKFAMSKCRSQKLLSFPFIQPAVQAAIRTYW